MDKLKNILNNINDRFSNPLIFSFFCSWLISNWQITVGLLWYDPKQIEKTGSNTIFEFIAGKINLYNSLWYPLGIAILYTFGMPIIKNIVTACNSWAAKWGDNWNIKILNGGKIPIEKYLKFREDYDKRTQVLEKVISKENEYLSKYETINTELMGVQSTNNELRENLIERDTFVTQLFDSRILDGYWITKYEDAINKGLKGTEEIYIDNNKYYIIEKFGEKKHIFNIEKFVFNNRTKNVFFIKNRILQSTSSSNQGYLKFNINDLSIEGGDLLTGHENGTTKIEYKKKAITPIDTLNKNNPLEIY